MSLTKFCHTILSITVATRMPPVWWRRAVSAAWWSGCRRKRPPPSSPISSPTMQVMINQWCGSGSWFIWVSWSPSGSKCIKCRKKWSLANKLLGIFFPRKFYFLSLNLKKLGADVYWNMFENKKFSLTLKDVWKSICWFHCPGSGSAYNQTGSTSLPFTK